MPIIDGKPQRAVFTHLKLNELSSVDRPAQVGAKALILKRDEAGARQAMLAEIAKYVGDDAGATTFEEVLTENEFSQEVWPMVDAFSQSIRSIVGDSDLSTADRESAIGESTNQFLDAVREIAPDVEKQLKPLLAKGKTTMATKTEKTAEQLQGELDTLKGELETSKAALAKAEEERDGAKEEAETAKGEATAAKSALEAANKGDTAKALADMTAERDTLKAELTKATDAVIKVDGTEIRKSEVGEQTFKAFEASEKRAQTAEFEKRAEAEFPHLPGTASEKGLILAAREGMDEPARKALDSVLKAGESMAKNGFESLGVRDGNTEPTQKAAEATYDGKVKEIAKRDGIPLSEAMNKARSEYPDEYAAAYGGAN